MKRPEESIVESSTATGKKITSKKKKVLTILLKVVAILIITIIVFFACIFVINKISLKSEQAKITPYGQSVTVDGKQMNVYIQGQGEETIVLLPGYGTAAPALDFKPLIDELSPYYKVVTIEPFGYGLSDGTNKERSIANIVSEVHEAVQKLNIDHYILMGHSIAGLYGIDYVNKYPAEVSAFIGIDSSVPMQGGMDVEFPIGTFKFLKQSGLGRLMLKFGADPYEGLPFDDETKEQIRMITLRNMYEATTLNELQQIFANFESARTLTFPSELPLLLFVQESNEGTADWIPLHEEQIKDSLHGKVITLDGDHYLHHTKSKEIAEHFRSFMEEIKK